MDKHYHLVATTLDANLSRAIKHLNGTYAQWWNHRHGRPGHVFQGRFGAQIIDDDLYLLAACRYVVLNPVRAGVVRRPRSGGGAAIARRPGMVRVPAFLNPDVALASSSAAETLTRRHPPLSCIRDLGGGTRGVAACEARRSAATAFLQQFSEWRAEASREVPQRERRVRPPLDTLFQGRRRGRRATGRSSRPSQAATRWRRLRGSSRSTRARSVGSSRSLARCQVVRNVWIQDLTPPPTRRLRAAHPERLDTPIDGNPTAAYDPSLRIRHRRERG